MTQMIANQSRPVPETDGRRLRHAHRRDELLSLATDYVFEHGLSELSLRPLATALGVSHRTLIHHFDSKEALLSEILREARARERQLVAARAEDMEGEAGFVDIMEAVWERSLQHLSYFRVYYEIHGLALQNPERYEGFLDGVVDEWLDMAIDLLRREGLGPTRAQGVATFVWAASRGLLLDLLTTADRQRVEAGFQQLVESVEAILAPDCHARTPGDPEP
jgi:AcrR family transcriptional regulator